MAKNIESTCFGWLYNVAKNIESTCFGWLYKVAKNIESTCFGMLYKVAKTSSQRVLVGYIKWRKHRVNVFW